MPSTMGRVLWWAALLCLGLQADDGKGQSGSLVTSVAWSSDGQSIASATNRGLVTGWNVAKGEIAWKWQGSTKKILGVYFDTSRQAFVVVQWPDQVLLLDAKTGAVDLHLAIDLPERDGDMRSPMNLSAYDDVSGMLALAGTIQPSIHLVNMRKIPNSAAPQVIALGTGISWLHQPDIDPSGETSAVMWIRRPSVSDADSGELAFDDSNAYPAEIALCSGGKTALGITRDGWFYRWDAEADRVIYRRHMETPEDSDADHAREFPHAAHLGCASESLGLTTGTTKKYGGIQLWDISAGVLSDFQKSEPDKSFYVDAYSIALSSDGRFAVTDGEGSYRVWNLTSGKLVRETLIVHEAEPGWEYRTVNFSFAKGTHLLAYPDGDFVFLADLDKNAVRCLGTACPPLTKEELPQMKPDK